MDNNEWNIEMLEVVKSEHEELAGLLTKIRGGLATNDRQRNDIEDLVSGLCTAVENHFLHEERGGYLTEALSQAPRFTRQAEGFLDQHQALLEEIEKLRLLIHSGVESPAWWARIETDFHKFASRLLAHEHAENALLQQAFSEDLGAGD